MSCIDLLDAVKNRVCDRCKSSFIIPHERLSNFYQCQKCNNIGRAEDFPKATIFDTITASPEVLAEEFVEPYTRWGENGYLETLWRSNFRELSGMLFATKEEAIAVTVEKLKEVEK